MTKVEYELPKDNRHIKLKNADKITVVRILLEGTWHKMIEGKKEDMVRPKKNKFPVLWRQEGEHLIFYPECGFDTKVEAEYGNS